MENSYEILFEQYYQEALEIVYEARPFRNKEEYYWFIKGRAEGLKDLVDKSKKWKEILKKSNGSKDEIDKINKLSDDSSEAYKDALDRMRSASSNARGTIYPTSGEKEVFDYGKNSVAEYGNDLDNREIISKIKSILNKEKLEKASDAFTSAKEKGAITKANADILARDKESLAKALASNTPTKTGGMKNTGIPEGSKSWYAMDKIKDTGPNPILLGVAGLVVATALGVAAWKLYKKYISKAEKACKGKSGREKTNCIEKYKLEGLQKAKAALKSKMKECDKSKQPKKCKYELVKRINKFDKKIEKSKMRINENFTVDKYLDQLQEGL